MKETRSAWGAGLADHDRCNLGIPGTWAKRLRIDVCDRKAMRVGIGLRF